MFVDLDVNVSLSVNLDDISFFKFEDCSVVTDLSNDEKLNALNGTSEKYCLWDLKELVSKSDVGDYDLLNVEVQ